MYLRVPPSLVYNWIWFCLNPRLILPKPTSYVLSSVMLPHRMLGKFLRNGNGKTTTSLKCTNFLYTHFHDNMRVLPKSSSHVQLAISVTEQHIVLVCNAFPEYESLLGLIQPQLHIVSFHYRSVFAMSVIYTAWPLQVRCQNMKSLCNN